MYTNWVWKLIANDGDLTVMNRVHTATHWEWQSLPRWVSFTGLSLDPARW